MARLTPTVQGETLTCYVDTHERQLAVGTPAWYNWLQDASLFAFAGESGSFTARKETKPQGAMYWKAYRKRGGRLSRAYLGKSEELSLDRLNAIAALLTRRSEGQETLPVQGPDEEPLQRRAASPDSRELGGRQADSSLGQTAAPEHLLHDVDIVHVPASNLPVHLTALIGREQERARVCGLLRRPEVRLLTLTGTGGIGKTRLGLAVANDLLADYAEGVSFVNLAPLRDPALVLPTIARTLNVNETAGRPLFDLLKAFLRDKHLLLVLDNFEQVLSAALQVAELLASCPHLKALVSSRAVLHVGGEQAFAVPPLAVPDSRCLPNVETLAQYEAVALFLQRAQALKPEFELTSANARTIAEICTRLEGLPLAIELAAARITLLPPLALLARLGQRLAVLTSGAQDAPARQQTLRHTIEWSYQLLNAGEQRLFRQLSVFVGGCTLPALEAVCVALGDEAGAVLDGVASLIDKSLLQQGEQEEEPRFVMLETIREYGLERLITSGEAEATRQAHAAYYLQLAQEAALNWFGAQEQAWLARVEREHDNLRTALNWLLERVEDRKSIEMALRLGAALWWFWHLRSHRNEGWNLLERALAASEGVAAPVRAEALWAAGHLAAWLGHAERAEAFCQQSLVLFREIGDRTGMRNAIFRLGIIADLREDYAAARPWFEESLVLSREVGDKAYAAWALVFLAYEALAQGEYARVDTLLEESLALFGELGNKTGIGASLRALLCARFFQGDLARARALAQECLALERELGNKGGEAGMLALLGEVSLQQGDPSTARLLLEQSRMLVRQGRDEDHQLAWTLSLLGKVIAVQGDYPAARALYEESLESLVRVQGTNSNLPTLDLCSALEGLAAVVAVQGELVWAARLWGAAQARRHTLGIPLAPVYRVDYERSVAAARTQLGEKPFGTAWSEGRTMTPEQALATRGPVTRSTVVRAEPATVPHPPKAATSPDGLTVREVEVLRLVAEGLTDAQVAEHLVISPLTVNSHLKAIYGKIGVSSRSAATRYAIEHYLL